jgi:hypothetical protein
MRSLTAGAYVLVLAAGLAACGGDDDDDASDSGSGSEAASVDTCDDYLAADTALDAMFSTEAPDEIMAAYEASGVAPNLDALEANPPEEVADEVTAVAGAIRELGETGDAAAIEEVDPAPTSAYYFENCDFETIAVTASEYAFDGIPDELAAGVTGIEFANAGTELHEIVIVKRNEGATQSVEELLAMSEEESAALVTFVEAAGANPGDKGYLVGDFEPGEYSALCFIAQGTTSEEQEGDGPPHAMEGMVKEFTVA